MVSIMTKTTAIALAIMLVLTLSGTALADNFVPSVGVKASPIVEEQSYILTASGERISLDFGQVSVTNVNGDDFATTYEELDDEDQQIYVAAQKTLKEAYEELAETEKLQSLVPGLEEDKSYVVKTLVDVTFYGFLAQLVEEILTSGGTVTLTHDLGVDENVIVTVSTKCENEWVTVPAENVVNNGDGTISVTYTEFCPIAFIVEGEASENAATSSSTSGTILPYVIGVAVCLVVGGVLVARSNKKKEKV